MRTKLNQGERAVAIVTVLLVLSILAVIGLGIATMGMGHMTTAATQATTEKAYMAAEAAALYMMDEYRYRYADFVPAPPGPGQDNIGGIQCTNITVNPRWLDTANSPGVAINAILIESYSPDYAPDQLKYTPPNAAGPIVIPNRNGQCAYIVGCGVVGNNTINNTTRYVGIMVRRSMPSGVFYFGAYANNTLDASGNDGFIDAWNSNGFTKAYDDNDRLPYVDVQGSGNLTDARGQTNLYAHVDGPVVKTDSSTKFMDGFGTVRQPGTLVGLPAIDWPTLHPSPELVPDITVTSGTVPLPGITLFGSNARNVTIDGGTLRLEPVAGANGSNFYFDSLTIKNGGKLLIDNALGPVNVFVTDGDLPMNITDATINTTSNYANGLKLFYNGDTGANIINSQVMGQLAADEDTNEVLLDNSTVFGSVTAFKRIRLQNHTNIHYDTALRAAGTPQGESLGIMSHQRL